MECTKAYVFTSKLEETREKAIDSIKESIMAHYEYYFQQLKETWSKYLIDNCLKLEEQTFLRDDEEITVIYGWSPSFGVVLNAQDQKMLGKDEEIYKQYNLVGDENGIQDSYRPEGD